MSCVLRYVLSCRPFVESLSVLHTYEGNSISNCDAPPLPSSRLSSPPSPAQPSQGNDNERISPLPKNTLSSWKECRNEKIIHHAASILRSSHLNAAATAVFASAGLSIAPSSNLPSSQHVIIIISCVPLRLHIFHHRHRDNNRHRGSNPLRSTSRHHNSLRSISRNMLSQQMQRLYIFGSRWKFSL